MVQASWITANGASAFRMMPVQARAGGSSVGTDAEDGVTCSLCGEILVVMNMILVLASLDCDGRGRARYQCSRLSTPSNDKLSESEGEVIYWLSILIIVVVGLRRAQS